MKLLMHPAHEWPHITELFRGALKMVDDLIESIDTDAQLAGHLKLLAPSDEWMRLEPPTRAWVIVGKVIGSESKVLWVRGSIR